MSKFSFLYVTKTDDEGLFDPEDDLIYSKTYTGVKTQEDIINSEEMEKLIALQEHRTSLLFELITVKYIGEQNYTDEEMHILLDDRLEALIAQGSIVKMDFVEFNATVSPFGMDDEKINEDDYIN